MATSERIEGKTPSGGAYAIVYFLDVDGEPVSKEAAVTLEIVEYDDRDHPLCRTYAPLVKPDGSPS
jgi:hypothetical protein